MESGPTADALCGKLWSRQGAVPGFAGTMRISVPGMVGMECTVSSRKTEALISKSGSGIPECLSRPQGALQEFKARESGSILRIEISGTCRILHVDRQLFEHVFGGVTCPKLLV